LSAAALLGKSLRNLEHQNFGFATEGRYLVSINPTLGLSPGNAKPEQMEPPAKEDTTAGWARAMPGFFETIGAKLVRGRPFTEEDTAYPARSRNQRSLRPAILQTRTRSASILGRTRSNMRPSMKSSAS
jgi:hypothetical protein